MTNALPARQQALELLKTHVKNENMLRHCLASEAVMRALAPRFNADAELWGLAGLLHDIDIEVINGDLSVHGAKAQTMLEAAGYPAELALAVKMHNEQAAGAKRADTFHKALAAAETIAGLITATTLVYPDKKLASVKTKSVVKRMNEKNFAASVNRGIIMECEQIGIPLAEFAEIAVGAMRQIAGELGL